jgi:hypothetical protein
MGVALCVGQTGTGDSNICTTSSPQYPSGHPENIQAPGGGLIVITSTIGATPTVTVNIQGQVGNGAWANLEYALVATPTTWVTTALTITTAVTNLYYIRNPSLNVGVPGFQQIKLALSANTNVTLTASYYA